MSVQHLSNEITGAGYGGIPITEIVTNGFFAVDHQWTVKTWNKAAEKLLRVKAKDIIGKNLWAQFADIIPLNFYTVYHKAFLHDIPIHFTEYWAEMGDWFDVITYYADGLLSVSFKSANQLLPVHPQLQLKILNELYRYVTEVTNDCLWELNIEGRSIFWIDGGHKRVFGYPVENALVPQSFWENCVHPDEKERVLRKLQHVLTAGAGETWEDEYRFKKADGSYAYVHGRGHVMYKNNKPHRMIGATQDITRRKLTEQKLANAEAKLSLIAKQTVNAVIIMDATEKITWVNDAFTRTTGYQPEEVMGKTPASFLHGADTDPATVAYLDNKMLERAPFDCEIINYTKAKQKCRVHVQGQSLLDEKGDCVQIFAIRTDITDKILLQEKLMEERLLKQREITEAILIAQENERSEIGRELHDNVNQILGATKLYIEMAKTGNNEKEMYLDHACAHLLDVIEEIRKISKTLVPQSIGLMGLGESIQILLTDLARVHPVKITCKDPGPGISTLDEKMQLNIFRIVQEQVNNIVKHAAATRASISLKKEQQNIILVIKDNGKGCNTNQKKLGIGTQNIQSRVDIYKGTLSIVSHPGKGYQLKVTLPVGTKGEAD